jgi:hypothetical protein
VKRASRFVTDQETGERVKREVPVQFRRWWWTDASNGKTYIQLRYGNKPLDLAKDKPTIELKNVDDVGLFRRFHDENHRTRHGCASTHVKFVLHMH